MIEKPAIYIVATPIGHLGDITYRAIEVLKSVDLIAAEDTRHSGQLLAHLGIKNKMISVNNHNERDKALALLEQISNGMSLALISDAGTPLISDPGYPLVRLARQQAIKVIPIPGACAAITALSASGLPTDRFIFEGFLPPKTMARQKRLETLATEPRTIIFYEAPHRILDTFRDMIHCFGPLREGVFARELTKTFETIKGGQLSELLSWIEQDENQRRGECVILVGGASTPVTTELSIETIKVLNVLLEDLSVKQASNLAARITGVNKSLLYEYAIKNKRSSD